MRKIIAIFCLFLWMQNVIANEYTDKLTVTVNGEAMEQQATITVEQSEDGKYTFSLKNFCLESVEADGTVTRIGVGNIVLPDIEGITVDGITTINYNDGIDITAGDDPDIEFWMGPSLAVFGPVPLELEARFNDTQLYCEIHINLEVMNQVITVVFGTEPTPDAVEMIKFTETPSVKAIFDIQGRRIQSVKSHMLYIVNGKKIVLH